MASRVINRAGISLIRQLQTIISPQTKVANNELPMFRYLGAQETALIQLGHTGQELVAAAVSVNSRIAFDTRDSQERIRRTLFYMMRRHPLLRCRLDAETDPKRWRFVEVLESNGLEVPFEVAPQSRGWMELFEQQLIAGYDYSGTTALLWRVILVPNSTNARLTPNGDTTTTEVSNRESNRSQRKLEDPALPHRNVFVFGIHHAIIDGNTLMLLLWDFLSNLDKLLMESKDEEDKLKAVESLPMPPCVEDLLPTSQGPSLLRENLRNLFSLRRISQLVSPVLALSKKTVSKPEASALQNDSWIAQVASKLWKDRHSTPRRTAIETMEFSIEETEAIFKAAKSRSQTVGALLQVAILSAIVPNMHSKGLVEQSAEQSWQVSIKVENAINMRRFFGKDKVLRAATHNICCTGVVDSDIVVSSELVSDNRAKREAAFWKLAEICRHSLHNGEEELLRKCIEGNLEFQRFASKLSPGSVKSLAETILPDRITISNIGNYTSRYNTGPVLVNVKASAFYTTSVEYSSLFDVVYITVGKQLFLTLAYPVPIITREDALEFCTMLRAILDEKC